MTGKHELYEKLSRYLLPESKLELYEFPVRDPEHPDKSRQKPPSQYGLRLQLRAKFAESYSCFRCKKVYRVDANGMPSVDKCYHHLGRYLFPRYGEPRRYTCCGGSLVSQGCSSNPYHVHSGDLELENYTGYVETRPKDELDPNGHGVFALDCEMCYTTYGLELIHITVIDHKFDIVYKKLVRPTNPILDYNTKFSGIKAGDLDNIKTTLADVQRDLLELFSSKSILIGHSLDSDMKALKIFHKTFIDTAQLYPHPKGFPKRKGLKVLIKDNLGEIIQNGDSHDSHEDAVAAFRLVMLKAKIDVPAKA